jgi:UDP-N-acetylglucosamine--N-acetylmuramyl-(pentapeptide) pyrophosphoryl-undecaprenol N-acetylglucosamine transferase
VIGYYVHHRGRGHLERMLAIAAQLTTPITALSSMTPPDDAPPWVELPADDLGSEFTEPTANGTLHWVPRHHEGLRARMALIAEWIAHARPALVVVDVSVEVATLCRLMGVPTVVVAMRGDRTDRAHRTAYDSAHALVAPWASPFAEPDWPFAWYDKTFHAGAISRFGELTPPAQRAGARRVLVLWGSGGEDDPTPRFRAAEAATRGWSWRFAGGSPAHQVDKAEVWHLLCWADVVITHGGQNAIAEVAAARVPAIVIADDRPHGEQHATVSMLDRAGVAVGLRAWPEPDRWPALLEQALNTGGGQWEQWAPVNAAQDAAQFLSRTAAELDPDRTTAVAGQPR